MADVKPIAHSAGTMPRTRQNVKPPRTIVDESSDNICFTFFHDGIQCAGHVTRSFAPNSVLYQAALSADRKLHYRMKRNPLSSSMNHLVVLCSCFVACLGSRAWSAPASRSKAVAEPSGRRNAARV